MNKKVPLEELKVRMNCFRQEMDKTSPDWETVIIISKINQYYFTGTMQDGMLIIPRNDEAVLWVRRSYERAMDESLFPRIHPMGSYRDAAQAMKNLSSTAYMETEVLPVALLQRLQKYFPFSDIKSVDSQLSAVRAVKSEFELSLMKQAGIIHQKVMEEIVPSLLKEGMSEAELGAEIFSALIREGHHGIARFGMFDTQMVVGNIGFGESSIYPTFFNGPGGNRGMCPAVPVFGSAERRLKRGDLVFVDLGCGVLGYHTDKTMTYAFGGPLSDEVAAAQKRCVEIQDEAAAMLKPGAVPSQIYEDIMKKLDKEFLKNFMGYGNYTVKFLGHSIGLLIDELPVIAKGFDHPICEGMVFALEPKKGIDKVGMVGIENTFLVTPEGGRSITGKSKGLVAVY